MIDYLPGALHWLKRRAELLLYHLNENLERLRSSSTGRLEIIEIRLEVQVGKIKNASYKLAPKVNNFPNWVMNFL